ncbi:MAG: hypothetical protein WDO56_35990 [Gammaproteobacteria bacterium]
MLKQSKDPVGRVNTLVESWRTQEPNRTFYGHTLPQFVAAVQPVFAVREEGAELAKRVRANSAKRRDVDVAALDLVRNIVHAVKADPAVGEDSLLYAAMGYVRKTDRSGGRKRARPAVVAAPEGDAKSMEKAPAHNVSAQSA